MLNQRILRPSNECQTSYWHQGLFVLFPLGPLCDMTRKTSALILDDKGENMERLKWGEIGKGWKSGLYLGPLPEQCPSSGSGALFKFPELLSQSSPPIHPVISWLDSRNQLALQRGNRLPMLLAFDPSQSPKSDCMDVNADSNTHFIALPIYAVFSSYNSVCFVGSLWVSNASICLKFLEHCLSYCYMCYPSTQPHTHTHTRAHSQNS